MARGGKREGAGRKPGLASVIAEKTRNAIAEAIDKEFTEIVKPQIDKAKAGDTRSFEILMDRAFGSPLQSTDVNVKDERFEVKDEQYKQLLRRANKRDSSD